MEAPFFLHSASVKDEVIKTEPIEKRRCRHRQSSLTTTAEAATAGGNSSLNASVISIEEADDSDDTFGKRRKASKEVWTNRMLHMAMYV